MIDFGVNVIWFSKERYRIDLGLWPHKHDYYHYIYILNGTGKITIDGNDYIVQENDFYLTHKGITHSLETKSKDGMKVIEIKFEVNNEQLASHLDQLAYRVRLSGLDVRHKLENFIYEGMKKEAYHEELINLQFTEILLILLRHKDNNTKNMRSSIIHADNSNNMDASRDTIDIKCLNDVTDYMKNNLTIDLCLDDLAKIAKMSKYHFCRSFKKHYGTTPMQHFIMLRISKAKELLMFSDMNITQIAYSVGFNDARYFSQVFKQEEALSPSEYAKKYKPNLYFYLKDRKDIVYR
jgi:AraC-like DNA-binding protein